MKLHWNIALLKSNIVTIQELFNQIKVFNKTNTQSCRKRKEPLTDEGDWQNVTLRRF